MKELFSNKKLQIKHIPGKGAWTYHIVLPGTKDIKGRAGSVRVSGFIDHYEVTNRNLTLVTNGDKMLSINSDIRKTLNKSGGDFVTVTMNLVSGAMDVEHSDITVCFDDAGVLKKFYSLSKSKQNEILKEILNQKNNSLKENKIISTIDFLLDLE